MGGAPQADLGQQEGWAEQNQQMENNTEQSNSDAEVGNDITGAVNNVNPTKLVLLRIVVIV